MHDYFLTDRKKGGDISSGFVDDSLLTEATDLTDIMAEMDWKDYVINLFLLLYSPPWISEAICKPIKVLDWPMAMSCTHPFTDVLK